MTIGSNASNHPSAPPTEHLLNCEQDKDVIIYVKKPDSHPRAAPHRCPAHSFILEQNPRFHQLLASAPITDNIKTIQINNVAPDIFDHILKYLYLNRVDLESSEQAVDVLEGACKYEVNNLIADCLEYLKQNLSLSNVLTIHINLRSESIVVTEDAASNLLNELKVSCREIILSEAKRMLKSEKLNQLPLDMLIEIIDEDRLGASELEVYNAIFQWSTATCKQKGLSLIPQNRRLVLMDALFKVRYFTMSYIDFENGPGNDDSPLLQAEKDYITAYFVGATNTRPPPDPRLSDASLYKKRIAPPPQPKDGGEDTIIIVERTPRRKCKRIIKRVWSALSTSLVTIMYWLD